jgi:GNAT superfamily N-acetyltransferase
MYQLDIAEAAAIPVTPPLENLHLRIVESREDALKLAAEGFENILEAVPEAERKLGRGAVAACAFLGRELASIDWMALSGRSKRAVDSFPYPADFDTIDSCTGGAVTMPHLRGKGIAAYRFSVQVSYLHSRGRRTCYNAISVDNIPSQRTVERYGATFDAVYRWRVLLGRSSYKRIWTRSEGPAPHSSPQD